MSGTLTSEQVAQVRTAHRGVRNAGLIACLVGVCLMVAGRFMPGAPGWLANAGLGVVIFGWGLFAYAFARRLTLARLLAARGGR